jgi:hypothetical protein
MHAEKIRDSLQKNEQRFHEQKQYASCTAAAMEELLDETIM